MSRYSKFTVFFITLALIAAASLAVAFPFWLASPKRSNPNDPLSPIYKPVFTGPQNTHTVSPTFTVTPTETFTENLGTPTPSQTPTQTQTPGAGPILANFEINSNYDNWNQPIVLGVDGDGSTEAPPVPAGNAPLWLATDQTADNGPSAAGTYSGCISGTLVPQSGGNFPFAFMALDVTPSGNTGTSGDVANIGPYCPNNGIQFDYMGSPGVSYVVQMITPLSAPTCGNYYQFQFTAPDANWHTVDVYFPGVVTTGNVFSQPNYGCTPPTTAWSTANVGAVQFKVLASTTVSTPYNLCVDNVTFNAPAAPVSQAVFTGETASEPINSATDLWSQAINITCTTSSTISPTTFMGSTVAPLDPNFPASNYYARISGTVGDQTGAGADPYPYAYMSFDLALGGTNGTNFTTCVPESPNNGFQFDYKAGASCVEYTVELISANITGTAYWNYTWTSQDTNWHTVDVYFPASSTWATPNGSWTPPSGVNVLTQPSYGTGAFDPTQVGSFLFKPVAPVNEPAEVYDLSIENLTFGVPAATGAPALDVSGGVNTAGTIISTLEYATAAPPENNECGGGTGPLAATNEVSWGFGGGATTVNNAPWTASSQTTGVTGVDGDNGPTLAGSSCMEFAGTLDTPGTGAYAVAMFGFAANAYPYGVGSNGPPGPAYSGNIETLAPHKRLVFDYKSGPAGEGEEIEVQFATQNASNYDFYYYTFTAASDLNWHTVIVYFPDSQYGPQFLPFPGQCVPWNPSESEEIEIGPVNPPAGESFDLYLDNLWFD